MAEDMVDVGLLLIGKKCANRIASALKSASKVVRSQLYVKIVPTPTLDELSVLREVYYEASRVCGSLDVRVILDGEPKKKFDRVFHEFSGEPVAENNYERPYRAVVLGGTFDLLHNGHKVLLSAAVLAASERIVCGVTFGEQNKKKCLWELMQPLEERMESVQTFVNDVSRVVCEVHPIIDAFGPSIVDPELEAIVVSEETLKGGEAVNRERQKKGLSTLDIRQISLVDGADTVLKENKLSSSSMRRALLGTFLRPLNFKTFPRPFVIGLTGGIASGKSNVARVLRENDAEVIDCDKLAHKLYEKGSDLGVRIGEAFGSHVLVDGVVDRKALGRIVFADKDKLKLLNSIVWPSLRRRVDEIVSRSTAEYVVVDAAILLEAEWDKTGLVHQVWSCIVPPTEAVKRAVERDGLAKEEAEKRINSQMGNYERVQRSDVVLCSLWEYEETARQITRALNLLRAAAKQQTCDHYSSPMCLRH